MANKNSVNKSKIQLKRCLKTVRGARKGRKSALQPSTGVIRSGSVTVSKKRTLKDKRNLAYVVRRSQALEALQNNGDSMAVDVERIPSKRSQKKAAVRAMQQEKLADELANDIGGIFIAKGTVLGGPPTEFVEAGSIMQVETLA